VRQPLGALTRSVAIYGAGDVAVNVVNLLLLPLYMRVLSPADFGALYLLLVVETLTKLLFRLGLDGAFMRYYLDRDEGRDRQVLASTLWIFLGLISGGLLLGLLALSPLIARHLFKSEWAQYVTPLRLALVNMYLLTFTFVPFHAMRMKKQAVTFSAFTFGRSVSTTVLRLFLVLWLGLGLTGMWMADLIVTIVVLPLLWPWIKELWRPEFSSYELRLCLRFGLPRLPHGLAQQALDAGNQYLLSRFIPLDRQGVYGIGATIGRGAKLFLSAFETGWAPFYYETARQPDAKVTLRKITTYGIAILTLIVAGSVAAGPDFIRVLTPSVYDDAGAVVPLIALGIALQGVYLMTSIGLNITSQTQYYPVSTFAAAAVGLGSGIWLMPRYGIDGAAVSFVLSYLTLAVVARYFSNQHYPMTYEAGRITRVVIAGVIAALAGWALPEMPSWLGVLMRGIVVVGMFVGLLYVGGFLRPTERAWLAFTWSARLRGRRDS
jgi:O-antigen/teichoic acid export membrane protein